MAKALTTREPTYKLPGAKVILQFARFVTGKRAQIASLAGEISQEYRDRKEKANVHSGAFNLCHKLVGMGEDNPMKLREWLAHFDAYRDDMKLDDLARKQSDFVADMKEEARSAKKAGASAPKPAAAKKPANGNGKKGPAETTREAAAKSDKALKEQVDKAEAESLAAAKAKGDVSAEASRADLH